MEIKVRKELWVTVLSLDMFGWCWVCSLYLWNQEHHWPLAGDVLPTVGGWLGAGQSEKSKFFAWEQAGVLGWVSRSQQGKSTDAQKVTYLRSLWLGTQKHLINLAIFFPGPAWCWVRFFSTNIEFGGRFSSSYIFYFFFEVEGLTMQWFTTPLCMQTVGAYGSERL